jgi:hypothetical protein
MNIQSDDMAATAADPKTKANMETVITGEVGGSVDATCTATPPARRLKQVQVVSSKSSRGPLRRLQPGWSLKVDYTVTYTGANAATQATAAATLINEAAADPSSNSFAADIAANLQAENERNPPAIPVTVPADAVVPAPATVAVTFVTTTTTAAPAAAPSSSSSSSSDSGPSFFLILVVCLLCVFTAAAAAGIVVAVIVAGKPAKEDEKKTAPTPPASAQPPQQAPPQAQAGVLAPQERNEARQGDGDRDLENARSKKAQDRGAARAEDELLGPDAPPSPLSKALQDKANAEQVTQDDSVRLDVGDLDDPPRKGMDIKKSRDVHHPEHDMMPGRVRKIAGPGERV